MATTPELEKNDTSSQATSQRDSSASPPTFDVEKGEAPEHAPAVEDSRPGAKAGLSLSQFWIVMFG
jgi:hypothetical protein